MPASIKVLARRCTVLLASPSRFARLLMPISYSSSENALIRRIELATDERRVLGFAGALALRSMYQNPIPLCGTKDTKGRRYAQDSRAVLSIFYGAARKLRRPACVQRCMNRSSQIFSHLAFSSRMIAG